MVFYIWMIGSREQEGDTGPGLTETLNTVSNKLHLCNKNMPQNIASPCGPVGPFPLQPLWIFSLECKIFLIK